MNFTKLKTLMGSCCYLLLALSVSVHAADLDQLDAGVSVDGWLLENGQETPLLSFKQTPELDEIVSDIRPENIVQDKDGSTRFQLSHSGPMSRQVFANVRRVEQADGYTRSIITNIADGQQTEYLSQTTEVPLSNLSGKATGSELLAEAGFIDDPSTECPWCWVVGVVVTEVVCAATAISANRQCRLNCRSLGGVKSFSSGICGSTASECVCWIQPRRIREEF